MLKMLGSLCAALVLSACAADGVAPHPMFDGLNAHGSSTAGEHLVDTPCAPQRALKGQC